MTICKFYQQGNCRYGDKCRFEHPLNLAPQPQQNHNNNRFSALQNNSQGGSRNQPSRNSNPFASANNRGGAGGHDARNDSRNQSRGNSRDNYYNVDLDKLVFELQNELPIWPLTCFAPTTNTPRQIWGGFPLEQSFEEMRLMYYVASANGNPQSAINTEQELHAKVQTFVANTIRDPRGALQYIRDGEREHPNRIDICNESVTNRNSSVPNRQNPFGSAPAQQTSASNPFGRPLDSGALLGQQNSNTAFVQPQTNQNQNPFGSHPASSNAAPSVNPFGQPPSSGSLANNSNPFGQPVSSSPSPFGSQPAQPLGFGNKPNSFGQAPVTTSFNQASNNNAFQSPSPFGTQANNQAAKPPNPFGQPSAFGSQSATPSPFGQPQQQPQSTFANGISSGPSSLASYLRPHSSLPPGPVPRRTEDPSSLPPAPANPIQNFAAHTVQYMNNLPYINTSSNGWSRVFCPAGSAQVSEKAKKNFMEVPMGGDQREETLRSTFEHLKETGAFERGSKIPEVAPKVEWIGYDL